MLLAFSNSETHPDQSRLVSKQRGSTHSTKASQNLVT